MAIKSWLKVQTSLEILENIAELFATRRPTRRKTTTLTLACAQPI